MIIGIDNEDVFILIKMENVGLIKVTRIEKSHIVWDNLRGGC